MYLARRTEVRGSLAKARRAARAVGGRVLGGSDRATISSLRYIADPTGPAPSITSAGSVEFFVGIPFSYQITATGGPTSFNATGLPGWATINTTTGEITGTPDDGNNWTATITATNGTGTGSASLTGNAGIVNPTLWIGAWETTSLDAPNIITGAPGGDFQLESGTPMALGDGGTSVGRGTTGQGAHTATVNAPITDFTIAAFMRAESNASLDASSPYMVMGDNGFTTNYILFHTYLESLQVSGTYGTPVPISVPGLWLRDMAFHHYAFVYTSADHQVKCYRDGSLIYDVNTSYDLFGGVTPAKFGLNLQPNYLGWMKNPVLTREALSLAAVQALAAGHLPNAAGELS